MNSKNILIRSTLLLAASLPLHAQIIETFESTDPENWGEDWTGNTGGFDQAFGAFLTSPAGGSFSGRFPVV